MSAATPWALAHQPSVGTAIFGAKGSDDALLPHMSGKAKHEESFKAQNELEAQLGFDDDEDRKALREASDAEFKRAADSRGEKGLMDRNLFVETVQQLWDLDRVCAKACFDAGDADGSGRINRQEWLILREAFVHRSPEYANHPAIKNLQIRAALCSYDLDKDGFLHGDELKFWLSDLTSGQAHVERISESLLSALNQETAAGEGAAASVIGERDFRPTIDRLTEALADGGALSGWLTEHGLSTDDMVSFFLKSHHLGDRLRVVYDSRAETARPSRDQETSVVRGGDATDLGPRAAVGGGAGIIKTDLVPGHAVNEHLTLQTSLRAVGGWRGPLAVQRSSRAFYLASHVIDTASGLAQARAHAYVVHAWCIQHYNLPA